MAGTSVPLQLLSGGGLVLFIAYYIYFGIIFAATIRGPRGIASLLGVVAALSLLTIQLLNNGFAMRSAFWIPLLFLVFAVVERRSNVSDWRVSSIVSRGLAA